MSPTTRSDFLKKKGQIREAYSRSAKRSLDNDFEATTSEGQDHIKKVGKSAAKNTNRQVAIENIDAVGIHEFVLEPLYEYLGSAHLILIPLTHKHKFHFTLLTLDPMAKCFFHYDSMSSRDSRSTECIKEADYMVHMINMWMRGVAFQADSMLNSGMRKKLNKGACSNVALQMDRDALTEKEILTIKWVKENFNTPFKLIDQKNIVSKQASGSLDCGVYVIHYMDDLAYERLPSDTFDEAAAMVFRADLIKRFARSSKRWRAAI